MASSRMDLRRRACSCGLKGVAVLRSEVAIGYVEPGMPSFLRGAVKETGLAMITLRRQSELELVCSELVFVLLMLSKK